MMSLCKYHDRWLWNYFAPSTDQGADQLCYELQFGVCSAKG